MNENPEDPWQEDKFDRKQNADDLISYIQSSYLSGPLSGEEKSQVIAVDAGYGIGKTFFLKAIARELKSDHAVAYIDAWSDDFVDEPIISLASTLRLAIQPWMMHEEVRQKWDEAAQKVGKIALIAGKGVAKQALKLLISEVSVTGIEAVFDERKLNSSINLRESFGDGLEDAIEFSEKDKDKKVDMSYIEAKISNVNQAKQYMIDLKSELSVLAKTLQSHGAKLPIYIIVDELDRCRPSYSIKMLEEIKHLFSLRDVVYILGINSSQLSKSIRAEYGAEFDGVSYLSRFLDRYYVLPYPEMGAFVEDLYEKIKSGSKVKLIFPEISFSADRREGVSEAVWLTRLLRSYDISPRHVYSFFERFRTALAVIGEGVVFGPYFFELIAKRMSSQSHVNRDWNFFFPSFYVSDQFMSGDELFNTLSDYVKMSPGERSQFVRVESAFVELLTTFSVGQPVQVADYPSILDRVGRFQSSIDAGG